MERVAVFDLNQTLYRKSLKDEFYRFICFRKKEKLKDVVQIGWWYLLKRLHLLNDTRFKENFFNYLDGIHPDKVQEYTLEFRRLENPKNFNEDMLAQVARLKEGIKYCIASGALAIYMRPLSQYLERDKYIASKTVYTRVAPIK